MSLRPPSCFFTVYPSTRSAFPAPALTLVLTFITFSFETEKNIHGIDVLLLGLNGQENEEVHEKLLKL